MKTMIILTILLAGAPVFLSSCRTRQWSAPPRPIGTKSIERGPAGPYYRSNADGAYYYSIGAVRNTNYRPMATRNRPM